MKRFLLLMCVFLSSSAWGQGTTETVFPYGLESVEGNANDSLFISPQQERQQWFRASYLSQVWNSPVMILGVAFRVEGQHLDFNGTTAPMEIWLQTTPIEASQLGPWNGAGTRVFASDGATIRSPGGASPNPFGIEFGFTQPFRYDRSEGNLVMRIVTFGDRQTRAQFIDAQGLTDAWETTPMAIRGWDVGNPDVVQRVALVTQFSWQSIPEPASSSLIVVTYLLFFFKKRTL